MEILSIQVGQPKSYGVADGQPCQTLARKFREVLDGSPVESSHPVMEYADLAPLLADARAEIRGKGITLFTDHWQACITDNLVDMVQDGKYDAARVILLQDLISGTTCDCTDRVCKMWEEKKAVASANGAGH